MTLTVRLPQRVEQELAEYCAKRRLTKSEAVKLALEELLALPRQARTIRGTPSSAETKATVPMYRETSKRHCAPAFASATGEGRPRR